MCFGERAMSKTTISITHYNLTHTTEVVQEADITDVITAFLNCLVCSGWGVETVRNGVVQLAAEFEMEEEKDPA